MKGLEIVILLFIAVEYKWLEVGTLALSQQMNWDDYQTYDTIENWLKQLAVTHKNKLSLHTIGYSTEGREIHLLKISEQTQTAEKKRAYWIDATIHAREWISTSTCTYVINQLLSPNGTELLSKYDFFVVPVINPDGYIYTHTTDRAWRKTRSNHSIPGSENCIGVDANRNFGFHFGGEGSSNDPCSNTYRGPRAYSEPEAEAIRNFIETNTHIDWSIFATLHVSGQLWMTPWGYTDEFPETYDELKRLGSIAVAAVKDVHGSVYKLGTSANILRKSAGSSRDWAYGSVGFKYAYTVELRPVGSAQFVLPKEQIIPTAEEAWAGLQALGNFAQFTSSETEQREKNEFNDFWSFLYNVAKHLKYLM